MTELAAAGVGPALGSSRSTATAPPARACR